MWDLPGPGLQPVSPALAGGFLTNVPPGKSLTVVFFFFLEIDILKNKFIYFWLRWVFVAALKLFIAVACCRARALGARGSVVVARGLNSCGSRALECRLSSYGARA